jgi:hypothetical protein
MLNSEFRMQTVLDPWLQGETSGAFHLVECDESVSAFCILHSEF